MKALVGAFNQEKALVGAFSVIVQPVVEPMEHYTALIMCVCSGWAGLHLLLSLLSGCSAPGVWSVSEVLASRTTGRFTNTDIICRILYKVGHFWKSYAYLLVFNHYHSWALLFTGKR